MAITIDIDTARPYQVHVGTFLLEQAGPLVRATAGGTKAVIVTDTNVGPLYQMPVKQSLEASGYEVSICTFEAGEAHKRAETYVAILEFVAEHELSRSDVIVALGGGVVGDVAGFVAATYMRGCKFVQIPTSLLAMVDSSVLRIFAMLFLYISKTKHNETHCRTDNHPLGKASYRLCRWD